MKIMYIYNYNPAKMAHNRISIREIYLNCSNFKNKAISSTVSN